jgi:hypothetical protein
MQHETTYADALQIASLIQPHMAMNMRYPFTSDSRSAVLMVCALTCHCACLGNHWNRRRYHRLRLNSRPAAVYHQALADHRRGHVRALVYAS